MPKKVVLNFPPHLIDQPITYRLIKDFGLVLNILRARITPREWGRMVVELAEDGGRWQDAMDFLAEAGVGVEPLAQEVVRHEDRCIHCTACVAPCPTKALDITDRQTMNVAFDRERTITSGIRTYRGPHGKGTEDSAVSTGSEGLFTLTGTVSQ